MKAFNRAHVSNSLKKFSEAVAFGLRAIELDPNFAYAYLLVSINYGNRGEYKTAATYARKAFELRERASEPERFAIEENYHYTVSMEWEKAAETLEMAVGG